MDSPDLAQLKQRMKALWTAGDFGQIARLNERSAEEFVDRLSLVPGMRVLDIACGTGNQSIPAARAGAHVTGVDIAPNLLQQARERARKENLKATFVEADAENLPHNPAEFEVVLSMFGAMFAPRPDLVVSELLRVCRPGGLIAMGNWTHEGFVGKSFAVTAKHVPPPPNIPPPVLWGDESVVAQRFGNRARLQMTRRKLKFDLPYAPAHVVNLFRTYFGPTKMAFERLDPTAQEAMYDELVRLWTDHNQASNGRTLIEGEYLEVHARPN